jgi:hypothetical protein
MKRKGTFFQEKREWKYNKLEYNRKERKKRDGSGTDGEGESRDRAGAPGHPRAGTRHAPGQQGAPGTTGKREEGVSKVSTRPLLVFFTRVGI